MVNDKEVYFDRSVWVKFGLLVFVLIICGLFYAFFLFGAQVMCGESGGVLVRGGVEDRFRCINVSNVDLCIDSNNAVVDKGVFDLDFNFSGSDLIG